MTQVKLKDASGRTHVICEGDAHTGEIRYAPTGHDMCRLRLFKNQAVKIQKKGDESFPLLEREMFCRSV